MELQEIRKKYTGQGIDTVDEKDFPGKVIRVLRPDEAASSELNFNRLNFKVDENDLIMDIVTDEEL